MSDDRLLETLADPHVLFEAQAASSPYVMHKAFAASKDLQAFKGRADLAPALVARIRSLTKSPVDPVVLSAHLYALDLTGAAKETRTAAVEILKSRRLRDDPMVGQYAGQVGSGLVSSGKQFAEDAYLSQEELQSTLTALEQWEGRP